MATANVHMQRDARNFPDIVARFQTGADHGLKLSGRSRFIAARRQRQASDKGQRA